MMAGGNTAACGFFSSQRIKPGAGRNFRSSGRLVPLKMCKFADQSSSLTNVESSGASRYCSADGDAEQTTDGGGDEHRERAT